MIQEIRYGMWAGIFGAITASSLFVGCHNTPVDTSEYAQGPAPLRMPSPAKDGDDQGYYPDSPRGDRVFDVYCGACHNARALAERPFSNYQNIAAHMRVRANLTGKEYAALMAWLRRWHDVPPANPPAEPAPTKLTFPQPISELQPHGQGKPGPGAKP